MKVIKPLYSNPEVDTYKFNTYHTHYINKLSMMESTYDSCLLYTNSNNKSFGVVDLQTDNILILANDIFVITKEKKLKEVKLLAKNREKLTLNILIKSNKGYIRLANDNSLFFSQKKQFQCLRLVKLKKLVALISFYSKIRKVITLKN